MDTKEFEKIVAEYERNHSIIDVAAKLGMSVVKVRRVLITEGLWSSRTSEDVGVLRANGSGVKEIAEKLHMSEKNVQAYMPYVKGMYNKAEKSEQAKNCEDYRIRNKKTADKQVKGKHDENVKMRREEDMEILKENLKHIRPMALKLKLEIALDELEQNDINVLQKYAKVKEGITREIIVPADMTLHALHYAIQRLFGWKNSHLHNFSLPESTFKEVTSNSADMWLRLCGVYFRFPDGNEDDRYWDDDYDESISFNTWLKWKYRGPYKYSALGDYYYTNQIHTLNLKKELPEFELLEPIEKFPNTKKEKIDRKIIKLEHATVDELNSSIDFEQNLNSLLERLFVIDYFKFPNNGCVYLKEDIGERLTFLEDDLEITLDEWKEVIDDIENRYGDFCMMGDISTTRLSQITDEIIYSYDFVDGWNVKITCNDFYYNDSRLPFVKTEKTCYYNSFGEEVAEEEKENLQHVISKHSPICIASDGINVVEDVGGVIGFCEFLQELHEGQEMRKQELKEWSRMMGWTGKDSKPRYRL